MLAGIKSLISWGSRKEQSGTDSREYFISSLKDIQNPSQSLAHQITTLPKELRDKIFSELSMLDCARLRKTSVLHPFKAYSESQFIYRAKALFCIFQRYSFLLEETIFDGTTYSALVSIDESSSQIITQEDQEVTIKDAMAYLKGIKIITQLQ